MPGLIGLESTVPIVLVRPVFMFAILFGLSMDYEVFLLSRIRERYLATGDSDALGHRRARGTARVITSAALIMIAVFLGFVLGDDPRIKMFGLGLATAIFVDATVVRLVLVPATMKLLGDANWWFPRLGRSAARGERARHEPPGHRPVERLGDRRVRGPELALRRRAVVAVAVDDRPHPRAAQRRRASGAGMAPPDGAIVAWTTSRQTMRPGAQPGIHGRDQPPSRSGSADDVDHPTHPERARVARPGDAAGSTPSR